jgi:hypothetical protein
MKRGAVFRGIGVWGLCVCAFGGSGCGRLFEPPVAKGAGETKVVSEEKMASAPTAPAAGQWREFRNQNGHVITARMLDLVAGQLSIEREDGRSFTSPLELYSEADRAYAKRHKLDQLLVDVVGRIPKEGRPHTTKRSLVESKLRTAESARQFYQAHIDRHGSLVGCRTVVVGQEARDHHAQIVKECADLRSVLEFGPMLDATLD